MWEPSSTALVNWQEVKTLDSMFQCGAMMSLKLANGACMLGDCAWAHSVASQRDRCREADGMSANANAQHLTSALQYCHTTCRVPVQLNRNVIKMNRITVTILPVELRVGHGKVVQALAHKAAAAHVQARAA
jgi:hypothetical protein